MQGRSGSRNERAALIPVEAAQAAAEAEAAQQERHRLRLGVLSGTVMSVGAAASFAATPLGVGRSVLFPALVPAISVLIGIPVAQETPGPLQLAGLATVTLGLLVCVGAAGRALRFLDRLARPVA